MRTPLPTRMRNPFRRIFIGLKNAYSITKNSALNLRAMRPGARRQYRPPNPNTTITVNRSIEITNWSGGALPSNPNPNLDAVRQRHQHALKSLEQEMSRCLATLPDLLTGSRWQQNAETRPQSPQWPHLG